MLPVGTKIRVKEDLVVNRHYGTHQLVFVPEMIEFRGQVLTIKGVYLNYNDREWYAVEGTGFIFCPEMFDVVTEAEQEVSPTVEPTDLTIELLNEQEIIDSYVQIPSGAEAPKTRDYVLIPTRKTMRSSLENSHNLKTAFDSGRDIMRVTRAYSSYCAVSPSGVDGGDYFNNSDLELYTINFVQGILKAGHRIKDDCRKTHTYEPYDSTRTDQTLLDDNTNYYTYIDSSGWYIRQWKQLVIKPRGTMAYTEYKAMCPECYASFKAQMELRMAYLKAIFARRQREQAEQERLARIEEERRQAEEAERERQRLERQRQREEEERALAEKNKYGIWKHHKKE